MQNSIAFKPQEPGALEGEISPVALDQQSVFAAGQRKLHPVAAFHLEGGVISRGSVALGHIGSRMVMGHAGSLGNHRGSNGQSGRLIILVSLAQIADNRDDDNDCHKHKQNGK